MTSSHQSISDYAPLMPISTTTSLFFLHAQQSDEDLRHRTKTNISSFFEIVCKLLWFVRKDRVRRLYCVKTVEESGAEADDGGLAL